jgi:uncharacterized protein (TIGR02452 family)
MDMKRNTRALLAKETLAICEAGFYETVNGCLVNIATDLTKAKAGTVVYSPDTLPASRTPTAQHETRFEVKNETTFQALVRLSVGGVGHLACLNFASAKNPGGGFLNGSLAQEEALACASGLYPCLLQAPEYYQRNRASRSALYLDLAIFSPLVPFFRNDAGELIEKPILASVITAPAPNAGAVARNEPSSLSDVAPTLKRRAQLVLGIARVQQVDRLVLGAWGCGVFRNEPRMVARVFAEFLKAPGKYANTFEEVVFAVLDQSDKQATFHPFAEEFERAM